MSQPDRVPLVSVLMTTHNGARFIAASIDSVLAQTLADFELVIVDDASTDGTAALLARITDRRVRVVTAPRNLGIAGARNLGFALCRGEFLAALDHDDLAAPERLATQAAFLAAHPAVVLVGSEIRVIDGGRVRAITTYGGLSPFLLRWTLLVSNPFTYSSIMLRSEAVRRLGVFMRAEFELADDFELYHRLSVLGDLARLDAVLATYRWHAGNSTHARAARQAELAAAILADAYRRWLGDDAGRAASLVVELLVNNRPARDQASLERIGVVLHRLMLGFSADHCRDDGQRRAIEANAARLWWRVARAALRSGVPGAAAAWRLQKPLRISYRPATEDILVSSSIGALRRLRR